MKKLQVRFHTDPSNREAIWNSLPNGSIMPVMVSHSDLEKFLGIVFFHVEISEGDLLILKLKYKISVYLINEI